MIHYIAVLLLGFLSIDVDGKKDTLPEYNDRLFLKEAVMVIGGDCSCTTPFCESSATCPSSQMCKCDCETITCYCRCVYPEINDSEEIEKLEETVVPISVSTEQYKNMETLYSFLVNSRDRQAYKASEILSQMVSDLFAKNYSDFRKNSLQLEGVLSTLSDLEKENLNTLLENLGSNYRV